jgi:hypothetical protein
MPRRHHNVTANAGYQVQLASGQGRRYQAIRDLGACGPCRHRLSAAGFTGTARQRTVCHDCESRGIAADAFRISIPREWHQSPEQADNRRVSRHPDSGEVYEPEAA